MNTATPDRARRGLTGRRRAAVTAGALALGLAAGAVVAIAPAQADTTVTTGSLNWGFRENFRTYVGNQSGALPPIGAAPVGSRITVTAPATFDAAGTPSVAGNNETKPYVFPVNGSTVASSTAASVQTSGAAVYNFPSHAFNITLANPEVQVTAGVGHVLADLTVVVPTNSLGITAGTFTSNDIVLGDATTTNIAVAGNGKSATITGTGVKLTAAGAAALQNFLVEGDALDNFTAQVNLQDVVAPSVPTVTVSKSVVKPAGETITVNGTGFDPAASIGTRPPLSGQQAGVYVTFGTFLNAWKPSASAPSSARKVWTQRWAVPSAALATIDPTSSGSGIVLNADGSFTATLDVKRGFTGALAAGNYGIYTYPGSGAVNAAFETYTPITFTPATGSATGISGSVFPGDSINVAGSGFNAGETVNVLLHSTPTTIGTLTADSNGAVSGPITIPAGTESGNHELHLVGATSGVDATIATFVVGNPNLSANQQIITEVVPTGALTLSIDNANPAIVLPSPVLDGNGELVTSGSINPVKVVDLRTPNAGWTVHGQVTDFAGDAGGTIDGKWLGWLPTIVSSNVATASAGPEVAAGTGIKNAALLGSATDGRGTVVFGAGLSLNVPTNTLPTTYRATLTLTALGS